MHPYKDKDQIRIAPPTLFERLERSQSFQSLLMFGPIVIMLGLMLWGLSYCYRMSEETWHHCDAGSSLIVDNTTTPARFRCLCNHSSHHIK